MDKTGNRGGDEIDLMTMITRIEPDIRKPPLFGRVNHEISSDVASVLGYLNSHGPSPITRIGYVLETSGRVYYRVVETALRSELIKCSPVDKKTQRRMRLQHNVKQLYAITEKGQHYLRVCLEMERLLGGQGQQ